MLRVRRKKLFIVLLALGALFLTLLSQDTVAYYSIIGEATNVITSGSIRCRIIERMGTGDFPAEGVYILPGAIVSKRVSVLNEGSNPFWVRMKLTNAIDDETLSADIMELDLNREDWIDGGDGYYYYDHALQPGEETRLLFSQVKIAGSADNSYLGKTLKLIVSAYAVQSQHNTETSPLNVVGWPAEKEVEVG